MNCKDIIKWAERPNLIKSSVGLVSINAILQSDISKPLKNEDLLETINIKENDTVGLIGYFRPFIKKIKNKKVYIFERANIENKDVYPDWTEDMYLPNCNIVIITATTLLNKTLDHILGLCKNAKTIAIVSPTTPIDLILFKKYGIHILAGIKVINSKNLLQIVSESGGTRSFKDNVVKFIMKL